jgi:hypothetical protein
MVAHRTSHIAHSTSHIAHCSEKNGPQTAERTITQSTMMHVRHTRYTRAPIHAPLSHPPCPRVPSAFCTVHPHAFASRIARVLECQFISHPVGERGSVCATVRERNILTHTCRCPASTDDGGP